jgi:tetratricopeptide (TPR) repeat protein
MAQGDLAQALANHEEAAALIRMGRVQSWAAGWALCSILYAARHRCDWVMAGQVADVFSEWSHAARMPAFPGTCQLHRAAVMGVRGDTARAVEEVRSATQVLAQVAPWAEGDAHCVLGDVLVLSGRFDEAESAYRRAHALGWEPQPGLARLHLLTGRATLAQRGLERALETSDWTLRERRGHLLCMLVHAAVAAGDPDRARHVLRMLDEEPALLPTAALKALHAAAVAEMALHDADTALAGPHLRDAVQHWREVGSPLLEAEARLRLAECLLQAGDAAGALHAIEPRGWRCMPSAWRACGCRCASN